MKAILTFVIGVAVGWLLVRRRPVSAVPAPSSGRPAFYTWTSSDGAATVAWPDVWYV
jgi:hypothetical protein